MAQKVEVKLDRLNLKYGWRWRIDEETCLICQQEFTDVCQGCTHPIQCVPCTGVCGHAFHLHCVETWLQNNKNCPMCRSVWEFKKVYKFDRSLGM